MRATIFAALLLATTASAPRDSVTIERNWRVLESQAAQDSAVEARKQEIGARGFAAWYEALNGSEEWIEISPGLEGGTRGLAVSVAQPAFAPGDSVTVTFTLTDAGAAPNADVWVYPYDAEADTLTRAGGIEVQRQVGPAWLPASPVFTRCDTCAGTYEARIPAGVEYGAVSYHYRGSLAPGFGEFVARALPQLTDGWVGSSPVVPLSARFVAADGDTVTLRFQPFRWKEPCFITGGCNE